MGDYVKLDQLKGSAIVYTKRFSSDEAVVVLQFGSEPLHLDLSDWSDQKLELVAASKEPLSLGGSVVEVPSHGGCLGFLRAVIFYLYRRRHHLRGIE